MIRSYLLTAFRSMVKQKVYTIINIAGLSTGIASCLLIILYVSSEFSYDNFHRDAERIYKIALERKYPTHSTLYAVIPQSYGDAIQHDFAEVEAVVKLSPPLNTGVSYKNDKGEEKVFDEDFVMAADSNFFTFFNFKIIHGDAKKALVKNTDLVLTSETAHRYFGTDDAIGKTLNFFNTDFTVTAVCETIPANSHIKFDFLYKWDNVVFDQRTINYTSFSAYTYIKLREGARPETLEAKFPQMVDTYASAQIEANLGKSWADYKKEGNGYRYFLQPLRSIHLDPLNIEAKIKPGGNRYFVYFMVSIAVLILTIACINFMNLATARASERAREVGVRKSLGSAKRQLVYQFLTESILMAIFAAVISLAILSLALPAFNSITGKDFTFNFAPSVIAGLMAITLVVGILAGIYPAFFLSSFNPVLVMKGDSLPSGSTSMLRNALVVFQFTISIILITGTLVVSRQMQYIRNKSLGFDRDQTIVVERLFALQEHAQAFIDEVSAIRGVIGTAGSFCMLGGSQTGDFFGEQWTVPGSSEIHTTKTMTIDDDFAALVNLEIVEGKSFSRDVNDSLNLILNETAVKTFKLENPVGNNFLQTVQTRDGSQLVSFTIIGVVKDFNFQTLHDPVTPLTIRNTESFRRGRAQYAYVKANAANLESVVSDIEQKWKKLVPAQPFKFSFLDQTLESNYRAEKTSQTVFTIFSSLAILIACIGLFGLSAYTVSRRTREIGIRKVLGASVPGVVILLSRDFSKLILFSILLAVPASWYFMEQWLGNFAYHVQLRVADFLLAGISALLIGWLTVSYQSVKAAIVNPIKSLRRLD